MTKLLLSTVAVLALAGAAQAAPAAADAEVATRHISTQGVNFNDPVQARRFYIKLQSAARVVCQSGSADQLTAGPADLTCIRDNMRDAVRQVAAPQLTAMLGASYGTRATAFATDDR